MAEILVLRVVHIVGGIFWVGSALFAALFLAPVLMTVGPAAGQVMAGMEKRRLFTILPIVALLTMLAGLRLMWIASGGFGRAYFETAVGGTYAAGGVAAIVAFLVALMVTRPATLRAGKLSASLGDAASDEARETVGAEIAQLRKRAGVASVVVMWLLLGSAVAMAVARYVR